MKGCIHIFSKITSQINPRQKVKGKSRKKEANRKHFSLMQKCSPPYKHDPHHIPVVCNYSTLSEYCHNASNLFMLVTFNMLYFKTKNYVDL